MLNIDVVGSREESELGEAETNYTQDEQTRFTSNTAAAVSTAATTSRTATTIVVVDGTWKDARNIVQFELDDNREDFLRVYLFACSTVPSTNIDHRRRHVKTVVLLVVVFLFGRFCT